MTSFSGSKRVINRQILPSRLASPCGENAVVFVYWLGRVSRKSSATMEFNWRTLVVRARNSIVNFTRCIARIPSISLPFPATIASMVALDDLSIAYILIKRHIEPLYKLANALYILDRGNATGGDPFAANGAAFRVQVHPPH